MYVASAFITIDDNQLEFIFFSSLPVRPDGMGNMQAAVVIFDGFQTLNEYALTPRQSE